MMQTFYAVVVAVIFFFILALVHDPDSQAIVSGYSPTGSHHAQ